MSAKHPVVVEQFGYRFAGRVEPTLNNIQFTLAAGSWTLVTGPTGSGKSTLLRALAGMIPLHASGTMRGSVRIVAHDTRAELPAGLVAFLLQGVDDQFCATTVEAEIAVGLENLALDEQEIARRIDEALTQFDLQPLRHRTLRTLSGGEKQRVLLASLLALRPRLLLLDEPLSQLDARGGAELLMRLATLHEQGLTIVLAEHRIDEVLPYVDQVLAIEAGRVSGPVQRDDFGTRPLSDTRLRTDKSPGAEFLSFGPLSFRHEHDGPFVWQDVQLSLRSGECVALVGTNGAGKSTLLASLAEVARQKYDTSDRLGAGLMLQNPDLMLFSSSVEHELAYAPRWLQLPASEVEHRVQRAAQAFDVANVLDEPPQSLSQGQRLRVALAALWTASPALLLLDEPTTGQDAAQVERLLVMVTQSLDDSANEPSAVVFATHDVRLVQRYADRVLILGYGRLLAFVTPSELLARDDLRKAAGLTTASESRGDTRESAFVEPTWLERCDPRAKLAWLAVISLLCVVVDSLTALSVLCGLAAVPLIALRWTRRGLSALALGVLLVSWSTMFSQGVFYSLEPRTALIDLAIPFTNQSLSVYYEGVLYGAMQSLRFLAGLLAGLGVCLSTSPQRLLAALSSLRVPAAISFVTSAALNFLPEALDAALAIRRARRLRRPHTAERWWTPLLDTLGMLMPLLSLALRRSENLATALTIRGFRSGQRRSFHPKLVLSPGEFCCVILLLLGGIVIAVLKATYWFALARKIEWPGSESLRDAITRWL